MSSVNTKPGKYVTKMTELLKSCHLIIFPDSQSKFIA